MGLARAGPVDFGEVFEREQVVVGAGEVGALNALESAGGTLHGETAQFDAASRAEIAPLRRRRVACAKTRRCFVDFAGEAHGYHGGGAKRLFFFHRGGWGTVAHEEGAEVDFVERDAVQSI